MMGKSHLQNKPWRKECSDKSLASLHMDIFSSSVISIAGHNFVLIILMIAQDTDGSMV
jgi:hypothetical protein